MWPRSSVCLLRAKSIDFSYRTETARKATAALRYSFGDTTGRSSRFGVVDVCSSSPSLARFVYLSILLPPTTDTDSAVATCLSARALRPQIGTCWPSSLTRHLVCASAAGSGEEGEKKTCPYHSPAMPTAAAASLTASFVITISSKYDRIIMQRDTANTNSTTSATRAPSKQPQREATFHQRVVLAHRSCITLHIHPCSSVLLAAATGPVWIHQNHAGVCAYTRSEVTERHAFLILPFAAVAVSAQWIVNANCRDKQTDKDRCVCHRRAYPACKSYRSTIALRYG